VRAFGCPPRTSAQRERPPDITAAATGFAPPGPTRYGALQGEAAAEPAVTAKTTRPAIGLASRIPPALRASLPKRRRSTSRSLGRASRDRSASAPVTRFATALAHSRNHSAVAASAQHGRWPRNRSEAPLSNRQRQVRCALRASGLLLFDEGSALRRLASVAARCPLGRIRAAAATRRPPKRRCSFDKRRLHGRNSRLFRTSVDRLRPRALAIASLRRSESQASSARSLGVRPTRSSAPSASGRSLRQVGSESEAAAGRS
jgi:hypothetical protein